MDTKRTQNKWLIDVGLFAGFMLLFCLDLTGVELHQWLGVVIGGLAVVHLLIHWKWVAAVTERFFQCTSPQARLYYLVDAGLGLSFLLILFSGLVISSWLSLPLGNYAAWKNLHILSSVTALLLVVVKIGTHSRWIVQSTRRIISSGDGPISKAQPARPAQPLSAGRRDFLKLMGVVGAAAFLAAASALGELNQASGNETSASQQASSEAVLTWYEEGSGSSYSACQVQCPRGCSYPGHCRRYQDSNGNGRCDLGECV
jgi:hypothetical protein